MSVIVCENWAFNLNFVHTSESDRIFGLKWRKMKNYRRTEAHRNRSTDTNNELIPFRVSLMESLSCLQSTKLISMQHYPIECCLCSFGFVASIARFPYVCPPFHFSLRPHAKWLHQRREVLFVFTSCILFIIFISLTQLMLSLFLFFVANTHSNSMSNWMLANFKICFIYLFRFVFRWFVPARMRQHYNFSINLSI